MKRAWLTILVVILSCAVSNAQVRMIVGGAADGAAPPAPSGVCTGSFNMSSDGVLTFVEQATAQQLDVAPAEDSNNGNVYFATTFSAQDRRIYRINNTFTVQATTLIDVANNPDDINSYNGTHYNTYTQYFLNAGRMIVAPCNVNPCLHFRGYAQNTLTLETTGGLTSGGTTTGTTYDSTDTYIQYNKAGGFFLGRYTSDSFAIVQEVNVDAVNPALGFANDTTYVYGTFGTTTIKRWEKSNLSNLTNFTPAIANVVLGVPAYDPSGFLWVPSRGSGATNNVVYKLNISDLSIAGSVTLGVGQLVGKVLLDTVNNKAYIAVASSGTQGQLVRVNMSTLAVEQTFNGTTTVNGPQTGFYAIDVPHQKIYIPYAGGGGSGGSRIEKVNLCS